jgi:uncharacterized repeat protein (TIGR03843 family)
VTVLASGQLEIEGRMPWSSNGTFLCTVSLDTAAALDTAASLDTAALLDTGTSAETAAGDRVEMAAIYKPLRGERPLWDFPGGLYRREVAAYELALQLGWSLVPETVEREDAPLGVGSVQRFVVADFEQHYFTLLEDERHHPALRRMAVFDVIANNADRKGGHCLLDAEGQIWGIDHGLCFHTSPKLRTVIWDWAGDPIDDDLIADVTALVDAGPSDALQGLLSPEEAEAMVDRAARLVRKRRLPQPQNDRPYPWPLV